MADSKRPNSQADAVGHSLKAYYYLTKPGIVYSNVMTGLAGYLFASKWHVNFAVLIGLLVGMSLIIASACVLNNYIDRKIDAKMVRTSKRALVIGQIKTRHALSYAAILCLAGFITLDLTNQATLFLGFVAIVSYVIIYGFFKRHSKFGTLAGTVPGAASLVAGYTAFSGHLDLTCLILFLIMLSWQMAHFYAIALYRLDDYKAANLPVWPVKRGVNSTVRQIQLFVYLFAGFNVVLVIVKLHSYSYLIIMLLASLYWLKKVKNPPSRDIDKWAKKVFLRSLIVILVFCGALAFGVLLP